MHVPNGQNDINYRASLLNSLMNLAPHPFSIDRQVFAQMLHILPPIARLLLFGLLQLSCTCSKSIPTGLRRLNWMHFAHRP